MARDSTQGVLSVFDFVQSRKYYGLQIPINSLMSTLQSWWSYQKFQTDRYDPTGFMQGRKTGLHLNFIPKYKLQVKRDADGGTIIQIDYWARLRKTGIAAALVTYGLTAAVGVGTLSMHIMEAKDFLKAFWAWLDGSYQVVEVEVLVNEESTYSDSKDGKNKVQTSSQQTTNNYYNNTYQIPGQHGQPPMAAAGGAAYGVQQQQQQGPGGYGYGQTQAYGQTQVYQQQQVSGYQDQQVANGGGYMSPTGAYAVQQVSGYGTQQGGGYAATSFSQYSQATYGEALTSPTATPGYAGSGMSAGAGIASGILGANYASQQYSGNVQQPPPIASSGGYDQQQHMYGQEKFDAMYGGYGGNMYGQQSASGGQQQPQQPNLQPSTATLSSPQGGSGYGSAPTPPTPSKFSTQSPSAMAATASKVQTPVMAPAPPPVPNRSLHKTPQEPSLQNTPRSSIYTDTPQEYVEPQPDNKTPQPEGDAMKKGGLGYGYTYEHLQDELKNKYKERQSRINSQPPNSSIGKPTN
eukprot:gene6581-7638_t